MKSFMERLREQQQKKNTRVCVGLDPDIDKLPLCCRLSNNPIVVFCESIVAATADLCCVYKPNLAFFSALGLEDQLARLIEHIQSTYGIPSIVDSKYGDIGNTAGRYAYAAFRRFGADAVTLNPYLGVDSIEPFAELQGSGVPSPTGTKPLYLLAAERIKAWNDQFGNVGAVFGATFPAELAAGRRVLGPDVLTLIPGIGKQGGPLEETMAANNGGFAIVNSSRAIIHASIEDDFAEAAAREAQKLRDALNAASPLNGASSINGSKGAAVASSAAE